MNTRGVHFDLQDSNGLPSQATYPSAQYQQSASQKQKSSSSVFLDGKKFCFN